MSQPQHLGMTADPEPELVSSLEPSSNTTILVEANAALQEAKAKYKTAQNSIKMFLSMEQSLDDRLKKNTATIRRLRSELVAALTEEESIYDGRNNFNASEITRCMTEEDIKLNLDLYSSREAAIDLKIARLSEEEHMTSLNLERLLVQIEHACNMRDEAVARLKKEKEEASHTIVYWSMMAGLLDLGPEGTGLTEVKTLLGKIEEKMEEERVEQEGMDDERMEM
ncbi:hypothetical protein FSHL1_006433 [Fusarium sambucinum]